MVKMKRNGRYHILSGPSLFWIVSGLAALLAAFLLLGVTNLLAGRQPSQLAAERWKADGGVAQISSFFSVKAGVTADHIESFRYGLDAALQEASIEVTSPNASARLWADAYSADGQITVNSERASVTADAIGIGGDFFLFHPLKLLRGSYFSGNDVNQDYCILDETAAWQLFGSNDVAGQIVFIGGHPHLVAGVIERETGRMAEAAGLDGTLIYVSYSTLEAFGSSNGINHYEIVMPNPVNGYAYQYVQEHIGVKEKEVSVIENTGRYGMVQRFRTLLGFGERSMNGKAIIYPYWENIARGYEDVICVLTLAAICLAAYPTVLLLIWLIKMWRKRTWKIGTVLVSWKEAGEERLWAFRTGMQDRRNKRKEQFQKEEGANE